MSDHRQEKTLATMRLHWSVFIPAFFTLFALSLPILPIMFFLKLTAKITSQFSPQSAASTSWIIWIALIPDALIFGIVMLVTWSAYLKSEIKLTSQRLIFSTGLLTRVYGDLPLENVESIFIVESLVGRLCGYGTVAVTSIGGRAFPLRYIDSPRFFHARLQLAVEEAKTFAKSISMPAHPQQDEDSRYKPKA
jgi:uncharacterized membrane protein YdbT with pleckstrin-like domain